MDLDILGVLLMSDILFSVLLKPKMDNGFGLRFGSPEKENSYSRVGLEKLNSVSYSFIFVDINSAPRRSSRNYFFDKIIILIPSL